MSSGSPRRELFGNVPQPGLCDDGFNGPDGTKFGAEGRLYRIVYGQQNVTVFDVGGRVGKPDFSILHDGLVAAGEQFGIQYDMIGPADVDPMQQLRIVEDTIAKRLTRSGSCQGIHIRACLARR